MPRRRRGRDSQVDRCPNCGSWRFRGACTTCVIAELRKAETEGEPDE